VAKPRFRWTLRPANSLWGLPFWRRRPPHLIGFEPWPRRVKPRLMVGEVYRGSSSYYCLLLPWGQLLMRCPSLPKLQHTGVRLPMAVVVNLVGPSAAECWWRCLILANSSQTKLVFNLVDSSATAAATCTADLANDVVSLHLLYCRLRLARTVGLAIGIRRQVTIGGLC